MKRRLNLKTATDTLRELAAAYIALVLVSALLFMAIESQPFLDSLYWAGTTATSTSSRISDASSTEVCGVLPRRVRPRTPRTEG